MSLSAYCRYVLFMVLITGSASVYAQLPQCEGGNGIMYYINSDGIYNYDPALPLSASNPALNTVPDLPASSGLAVSANLNVSKGSTTFYTVRGGVYHYYDGTTWVNTNHSSGATGAVNIGAGGGYIFSLDPLNNRVFRYDGTGNAVLIKILPGSFNGIADLVVDCKGNFYVLNTFNTQFLRKYDLSGNLVYSWPLVGIPSTNTGAGFSIIGDKLYYTNDVNGNLFEGQITCNAVVFSAPKKMNWTRPPGDFGECQGCMTELMGRNQTQYFCRASTAVQITASGGAPYSWSVVSGSATVSGTGPAYSVSTGVSSTVVLSSRSVCGVITDTFQLIVPSVTINPLPRIDTIKGCGKYTDTLHAQVSHNTSEGLALNYQWAPAAQIVSGSNTLDPVVNPSSDATFVLTVSTPSNQGGCTWQDSIRAIVKDRTVVAAFSTTIGYNCGIDTVTFHPQSSQATASRWLFGDGSASTQSNPTHIYNGLGSYTVLLESWNETCHDTISKTLDLKNPIITSFTTNRDTICQGEQINFVNTSLYDAAKGPAQFTWTFGTGLSATSKDAQHVFQRAGLYKVKLIGISVGKCVDSAFREVVVDSLPIVTVDLNKSAFCIGEEVTIQGHYTQRGNTRIEWDLGDGTSISDLNKLSHTYSSPGSYTINLSASYRVCPDQSVSKQIQVGSIPVVDLGRDTTICAEDNSFVIGPRFSEAGMKYRWSTGERTSSIMIGNAGQYILTIDVNGCANADTLEVSTHTCNCMVSLPSAFTPNGDGRNDIFRGIFPSDCTVKGFGLFVYNRWGQQVFATENAQAGWDGRISGSQAEPGTYYYMARYYIDSSPTPEILKGDIVLLR